MVLDRRGHPFGEAGRHLVEGEDPADHGAAHDHQHDHARGDAGLDHGLLEPGPGQVAVEEQAEQSE